MDKGDSLVQTIAALDSDQADIIDDEPQQSITITVNMATGEVSGHHDFEGYIEGGYRSASYQFFTYLEGDSFSDIATGIVYVDGQEIGEYDLRVSGEVSYDLSFIAGDIIDETVGYGVIYYAYLISQSKEQPEGEDY